MIDSPSIVQRSTNAGEYSCTQAKREDGRSESLINSAALQAFSRDAQGGSATGAKRRFSVRLSIQMSTDAGESKEAADIFTATEPNSPGFSSCSAASQVI
jgi:hypothetical protein